MPAETLRCAAASESRDEPLYGTASIVRRWLLLEQPGAWGYDASRRSRLPEHVAREIRSRARAAGVRIILIRRGLRLAGKGRRCYFARTDQHSVYMAEATLSAVDDVLDLDLAALRDERPVRGATPRTEPVFLVCTHGRHDACCSIRGNQVARLAKEKEGLDAWECSHIGGDRFAANLVCFPHGIYYGRVEPDDVGRLMEAYADGAISLDHYRGRCCYRFAVQAAEYFLRKETGILGVDEVSLVRESTNAQGAEAQFVFGDGGRAEVRVQVDQSATAYRLTCRSTAELFIPRYELVSCKLG